MELWFGETECVDSVSIHWHTYKQPQIMAVFVLHTHTGTTPVHTGTTDTHTHTVFEIPVHTATGSRMCVPDRVDTIKLPNTAKQKVGGLRMHLAHSCEGGCGTYALRRVRVLRCTDLQQTWVIPISDFTHTHTHTHTDTHRHTLTHTDTHTHAHTHTDTLRWSTQMRLPVGETDKVAFDVHLSDGVSVAVNDDKLNRAVVIIDIPQQPKDVSTPYPPAPGEKPDDDTKGGEARMSKRFVLALCLGFGVGVPLAFAACFLCFFIFYRRRKKDEKSNTNESMMTSHSDDTQNSESTTDSEHNIKSGKTNNDKNEFLQHNFKTNFKNLRPTVSILASLRSPSGRLPTIYEDVEEFGIQNKTNCFSPNIHTHAENDFNQTLILKTQKKEKQNLSSPPMLKYPTQTWARNSVIRNMNIPHSGMSVSANSLEGNVQQPQHGNIFNVKNNRDKRDTDIDSDTYSTRPEPKNERGAQFEHPFLDFT